MCFQIWQLRVLENGGVSVEVLSDLTRHSRAVNVVRFSPEGDYLASADDGKLIVNNLILISIVPKDEICLSYIPLSSNYPVSLI